MESLFKVTALVKQILTDDVKARNDDSYLYYLVLQAYELKTGRNITSMRLVYFLNNLHTLGVPPFESVRRARQKVQAAYPALAADSEVEGFRTLNEATYKNFARKN